MLGDVSATKRYPNSEAVLKFNQGYTHFDYLMHLYELFDLYVASPPRVYEIKRGSVTYRQVSFQTLSFPFFSDIKELFYDDNGKKRVPVNIAELLTPAGLAYWFQDDGAKAGNGFLLHTDCFYKADVERLIEVLQSKFRLQCNLRDRNPGQHAIYINVDSRELFFDFYLSSSFYAIQTIVASISSYLLLLLNIT